MTMISSQEDSNLAEAKGNDFDLPWLQGFVVIGGVFQAGGFRVASQQVERKLVAILVSDVVGYSRLTGANEDLTLARLRALRSDLVDPIIAVYHGRVVKR